MSEMVYWTHHYDVRRDAIIYRKLGNSVGSVPAGERLIDVIHESDVPKSVLDFCSENEVDVCSCAHEISKVKTL